MFQVFVTVHKTHNGPAEAGGLPIQVALRLDRIHLCVDTASRDQGAVCTAFDEFALTDHQDFISHTDRREAMRDENFCGSRFLCIHLFKYRLFGLHVKRGRRLVENNDWSTTEKSSCQCHALPIRPPTADGPR